MKDGFSVKVGEREPAFPHPVAVRWLAQPRLRSDESQVEEMIESFVVVFEEIDATYHEFCRRAVEGFTSGRIDQMQLVQSIQTLHDRQQSVKEALREVSTFISQP